MFFNFSLYFISIRMLDGLKINIQMLEIRLKGEKVP
jgi:hypothetical protein